MLLEGIKKLFNDALDEMEKSHNEFLEKVKKDEVKLNELRKLINQKTKELENESR